MTVYTPRKIPRNMADAVKRAAGGERIIVKRRGKANVAIVPVEDAEYMQRLEDQHDLRAAEKGMADLRSGKSKPIPWKKIKSKWGL